MFGFEILGYNSGKVLLVDVENHQILHTLELKGEIVSINWTQNTKESYDDFDDLQGNTKLVCILALIFSIVENFKKNLNASFSI